MIQNVTWFEIKCPPALILSLKENSLADFQDLNVEYRGKQRTGKFQNDMSNRFNISKFLRPRFDKM